jgi:hypothetical protein
MKIGLFLGLLCLGIAFQACNKSEIQQVKPIIEIPYPDTIAVEETGFLKTVNVTEATKVTWDTLSNIIQVVLPEGYTEDIVYLNVSNYSGANVELNSWDELISAKRIGFRFKGGHPYVFSVSRRNDTNSSFRSYTVYVEHLGKLTAELLSPLEMQAVYGESTSVIYAGFKFTSGIGTIPERPGDTKNSIGVLSDVGKNISIKETAYSNHVYFQNAQSIVASSQLSLSLTYGDKTFTFPNTYQPVRANVTATMHTFSFFAKNKEIEISGGYFINGINYRVKVENAFTKEPMWVNAKFKTPAILNFEIPGTVANGDYLFGIYEGEHLLTSTNFLVSEENVPIKGIGKIWTEKTEAPSGDILYKDSKRVSLNREQVFYADPKPWILGGYLGVFDPNRKMPDLELKNNDRTIIIPSKTKGDMAYGDASIPLYYCEYKLPAEVSSGDYEARMVYENGEKSAPWWALIKVN